MAALALTKLLPTGVSGTYFKITAIYWDGSTNTMSISVACYLSQAAANAGSQPLFVNSYSFSVDLTQSTALITNLYNKLKTHPDFAGATDTT